MLPDLRCSEEHATFREFKGIFSLRDGISIVQNYQNCADSHAGEEDCDILLTIAGHDSYRVSMLQPEREHGSRCSPAVAAEVIVRKSYILPRKDCGVMVSESRRLLLDELRQSQLPQLRRLDALDI